MDVAHYIKLIGQGGAVDAFGEEGAHALLAAIMDGGVPDLELGAVLMALRAHTLSAAELLGFQRAMAERVHVLRAPPNPLRPLVFASYNGARTRANLLPLLLLMLRRMRVPALVHGTLEGCGRVATVYILRELGVLPCASHAQAQSRFDEERFAFVPTAALCPGLAHLLALRSRLGVRNVSHDLVKLLDPFGGEGVLVASASEPGRLELIADCFAACGADGLLLTSTEGEPFANPLRRPRIRVFRGGSASVLFEEEAGPPRQPLSLPSGTDAVTTGAWIRQAMAGEHSLPHPIVNQLACCLLASGYADDLNQAKALAMVEAGGFAAHPGALNAAVN